MDTPDPPRPTHESEHGPTNDSAHDPAAEALLREALAPLRPAPGPFLDAVRARIAREEERALAKERALEGGPAWIRHAAGMLPVGLLPPAVSLGKKLTIKSLPGLLALPAASLVMVLLSFSGALLSLRRNRAPEGRGEGEPSLPAAHVDQELVSAWWRRNRSASLAGIGVVILLALTRHPETAMVFVALSIAAVAMLLGELGRHGIVAPKRIGNAMSLTLSTIGSYWISLQYVSGRSDDAASWFGPFVFFLGSGVCHVVSGRLTWRTFKKWLLAPIEMKHPDPVTTGFLRVMSFGLVTLIAVFWTFCAAFFGAQLVPLTPTDGRLAEWARSFEAPIDDVEAWGVLGDVHELLNDKGVELTSPGALATLSEARGGDLVLHPDVDEAAMRLGLVPKSELAERAARVPYWTRYESDGAHNLELQLRHARLWLEAGRFAGEEARAAATLADAWPEDGSYRATTNAWRFVTLLDELGATDEVERLAPRAAALLSQGDGTGSRSKLPFWGRRSAPFEGEEITAARLLTRIARVRPSGDLNDIDIPELRARLFDELYEARGVPLITGPLGRPGSARAARLEGALLQLESLEPAPLGVWARTFLRTRHTAGPLLLVAFCLVAVWRAHRRGDA